MVPSNYMDQCWLTVNSFVCGVLMPYGNKDLDQHSSSNGLLHECTKPLPEQIFTNHQWGIVREISYKMFKLSILDMSVKITTGNLKLQPHLTGASELTQWGRVTHICINKLTIISSDNSLLPGRRQAFIYTNAGILLIGSLETNFSEILIKILTFSLNENVVWKIAAILSWPQCVNINIWKTPRCYCGNAVDILHNIFFENLEPKLYQMWCFWPAFAAVGFNESIL